MVDNGITIEVLPEGERPYVEMDGPLAVHGPWYVCSNNDTPQPPVDCGQNDVYVGGTVAMADGCLYLDNDVQGRVAVVFQHGVSWDDTTQEIIDQRGGRVPIGGVVDGLFYGNDGGTARSPDDVIADLRQTLSIWQLDSLPDELLRCLGGADVLWLTGNIWGLA